MKISRLLTDGELLIPESGTIADAPTTDRIEPLVAGLREGQERLRRLAVDDILAALDQLAQVWGRPDGIVQKRFGRMGLGFALQWLRSAHLRSVTDQALRGSRHVLDDFQSLPGMPYRLTAQPRGLACHWLAGNVPMLGLLSLVNSLVTKNASLLKVPREGGEVLPTLLAELRSVRVTTADGGSLNGGDLLGALAVIYVEKEDRAAQEALSRSAQVRVAWGSRQAVETIMNLPHSYGCEDVVFGPRTSFMVVGREMLGTTEQALAVAKRASIDASLLDQMGCNSPHTIFVEKDATVSPSSFARLMADEMARTAQRIPRGPTAPADSGVILRLRAEYDMRGEAFYPQDTSWTVLYSDDDKGLATPCFNRTVFVRPVQDVAEVAASCSHLTQSAGAALAPERRAAFARLVSARGIDRVPEVGSMTLYEIPWDGMFPMDRMVRWCRL